MKLDAHIWLFVLQPLWGDISISAGKTEWNFEMVFISLIMSVTQDFLHTLNIKLSQVQHHRNSWAPESKLKLEISLGMMEAEMYMHPSKLLSGRVSLSQSSSSFGCRINKIIFIDSAELHRCCMSSFGGPMCRSHCGISHTSFRFIVQRRTRCGFWGERLLASLMCHRRHYY